MLIRQFARVPETVSVPDLVEVQTRSYRRFLQDTPSPKSRKNVGLEALFREMFPIKSYDGTLSLEYICYDLGRARYSEEDCRRLRLTYGRPLRARLRLNKPNGAIQEDVYLGDVPIMIGGEFIVNGAQRVIVAQLHRSPGVDFQEDTRTTEKRLHSCRIIPERGSWIEIDVSRKDVLYIRVDQSGRFPITCFIRALSPDFSTNADIIRQFYETEFEEIPARGGAKLRHRYSAEEIVDPGTGEVVVSAGQMITDDIVPRILALERKRIRVIAKMDDALILNTLNEETSRTHEEALLHIYGRLRPGNPPSIERARELFHERFLDPDRYRLGPVGRFRLNRKFNQNVPMDQMMLHANDIINAVRYTIGLRRNEGHVDDIDHLGNRRLRTIDELAGDELRKGFLKLRRTVQERMGTSEPAELTPRSLVNSKTISAAIEFFFGRSELSQVVEQTNPLHQLTHERKLSALGPGGLNRKRAGFEVRDVHISHYGRICPIETPEGANIGLITSLGIFAGVDDYGFIVTPYRRVKNGVVTDELVQLRADEEIDRWMGPADLRLNSAGKIIDTKTIARRNGDFLEADPKTMEYADVAPNQIVGVSASLIPFLEHNDANRALMGSNMQKQAVPLLRTELAMVITGMEKEVVRGSSMVVRAEENGVVEEVDATHILIGQRNFRLRKFNALNEKTCLNQRPIVHPGQKVKKGEIIADGAGTSQGELALGKNALVAFMPWDGYNFEDAILMSERLVEADRFTSIHIQEFEIECRETKLGKEEFTRDIPNVPQRALANLDEDGIVRVGTHVRPGDILVGKVSPKSKTELTPEEKLLIAIFGQASEDVKNESLEVPAGVEGIIIHAEKFSRKGVASKSQQDAAASRKKQVDRIERQMSALFRDLMAEIAKVGDGKIKHADTGQDLGLRAHATIREVLQFEEQFDPAEVAYPNAGTKERLLKMAADVKEKIERLKDERDLYGVDPSQADDLLPSGVLSMVKIYIATKRVLSVGDKMAGRHGNKGVIARIMPVEDMPYLEDGTPVEVVLNPLGVPSRMNVGQILETHLGWAAKLLGFRAETPVFNGASEEEIRKTLIEAGLPEDGKAALYDGRTGEQFEQKVTVGYLYMMKLDHLVDDKVHARATGPYSLVTQQPLGGKARSGGQRFGEMEVWAMEAYGAAYTLQELLTVKSDDIEGRAKIYESMVKGTNVLEASTPVSFEVLMNEIRGLGLKLEMQRQKQLR
ncbi:MAG: DNA-directed RNA polymerase subunit beta [Candidatus Brocadiia bacterium]